jgi:peptide chain release factor 1
MEEKLQSIIERYDLITADLNDPLIINDTAKFRIASREYKTLEPIAETAHKFIQLMKDIDSNAQLIESISNDPDLKDLAFLEKSDLQEKLACLEDELKILLIPKDPNDTKNCVVEIRAGTGGDEAAIFVGDVYKMYQKFTEQNNLLGDKKEKLLNIMSLLRKRETQSYIETVMPIIIHTIKNIDNVDDLK